tara:strand:- start:42 stop:464 length:423 start_codon:yes stop_codon:yes gene_type:complete
MFPHVGWSLDALDGKSIICEKINRVDFPIAGIYGFRFIGNKVSGDFLLTKNYEVTIYNFNNYSMKSITVDFISWLDRDIGMGWKLNRETLILNHIVNNGPTSSKYQCNVMPDLETYNKEMEAYRLEHFKKLKDKLRKNKI